MIRFTWQAGHSRACALKAMAWSMVYGPQKTGDIEMFEQESVPVMGCRIQMLDTIVNGTRIKADGQAAVVLSDPARQSAGIKARSVEGLKDKNNFGW